MSFLFVWNNGLLLLLAIRLPQRLLPGASPWHRTLAAILSFPIIADLAIFATSSIGYLTPIGVGAFVTAGAVLELFLPVPAPPAIPPDDPEGAPPASRTGAVLEAAGVSLFAGLALLWFFETGVAGTSFRFDDLTYHATSSAWWLQKMTLSLPPFTYQGYYPHNAELMNLWFMLPLRSDAHANLAVLVWIALGASALLVIARNFAGAPSLAFLAASCLLVSPRIRFFTGSFTAGDLAAASCGLTAFAFSHVRTGSDPWTRFGTSLLCGLAAGAAVGTKASMIAPMGLLALWWCWRSVGGGVSGGIRRRELFAFALGLGITGSYWYGRNCVLTGNPLFPAEIGPFAGPFDRASQWQTTFASYIALHWREPVFWRLFLHLQLDWPLRLGQTAALGYLLTLVAAVSSRRLARAELRPYALLLATAGLLSFVLFSLQPFSATINRPDAPVNLRVRYLSFAFALGLALYGSMWPRRPWATALFAVLPGVALLTSLRSLDVRDSLWVGAGAAATALLWTARRQWPSAFVAPRVRRVAYGALALALVALALWTPGKARWTAENLYSFRVKKTRQTTPAWSALEQIPPGSRVAGFSFNPSSHLFYYPLFGRSLQLRVVPVDHRGRRLRALHLDRESSREWWWEFRTRHDVPGNLLENLRVSEVDYLFISRWPRESVWAGWPPVRSVLVANVPNRRIFGDSHSEIWDVRSAPDAPNDRSERR